MKASVFVCTSALLFASWLSVTFLREVPSKDYPTLGKGSVPVSAKKETTLEKEPLISVKAGDAPDMAKVR